MIYVSEMKSAWMSKRWHWKDYSYLIADSEEELHRFAERLGLKREWFQAGRHSHYDLTNNKRRLAIRLGAKEILIKDFIKGKLQMAGELK